jgi:hypothetical protein
MGVCALGRWLDRHVAMMHSNAQPCLGATTRLLLRGPCAAAGLIRGLQHIHVMSEQGEGQLCYLPIASFNADTTNTVQIMHDGCWVIQNCSLTAVQFWMTQLPLYYT